MMDVTIVGAGVVGLCVGTELRARGASVTIIDQSDAPGPRACSWWAGGMLAPWCEGESAEEPVVRLGQEAAGWWGRHAGNVQTNGTLVLALGRDQAELKRFGRRTSHFEAVDGQQIGALEPDLANQFSKGLYFADEAHLAPRQALSALKQGLVDQGVVFRHAEVEVSELAAAPDAAHITIDCRGLAAKDAFSDLRGVKGEMLLLSCPDLTLSRPIRLLHPRIPLYVVPRGDGVFMLGATMLESDNRSRISARSMLELLSAAYALNPIFGEAEVLEIGVDARPAFADNLPRIRRRDNLIHVNGLYRHGFLLAPAMARMVAGMLFENTRPEVMDAYPC